MDICKMTIIDNFYAALYTKAVRIGQINPPGEADHKGYSRKQCCFVNGRPVEDITFDKAEAKGNITCIAIMTGKGRIITVSEISPDTKKA